MSTDGLTAFAAPTIRERLKTRWSSTGPLLRLAAPMAVASLSTLLFGLVDAAIVGHLNTDAFAGVALAVAIYAVASELVGSFGVGLQISLARSIGAKRFGEARELSAYVGKILVAVALVLCAGLSLSAYVVDLAVADKAIARAAASYLKWRSPELLCLAVIVVLRVNLNVRGEPRWGMYAAIAGNIVNLALSSSLVFGFAHLPALGAPGAAIGSMLTSVGLALYYALVAHRRHVFAAKGEAPRPAAEPATSARQTLSLVGYEMANVGLDYLGNLLFVAILAGGGAAVLAGSRVASSVLLAAFVLANALGSAAQILIGRHIGAAESGRADALFSTTRALAIALFALLGAAVMALSGPLASLFTADAQVRLVASRALVVVGLTLPLMAWNAAVVACVRAYRGSRWVMWLNVAAVWGVQLPIAYVFARGGSMLTTAYLGLAGYFLVRAAAGERVRTTLRRHGRRP